MAAQARRRLAQLARAPRPALPPQRAIARLTGLDNLTEVYAERTRLMIDAQRACRPGVVRVRLVDAAGAPATPAPIASVGPAR